MRARKHSHDGEDHGIDLAPMLDFVMNLLIFFIITTSFIKEAGITVTRPNADTAEQRESGNILIAVRENGEIWMDRKQVDIRQVRGIVERMHVERPDDSAVIIGDKQARAGVVAQLMDEVRLGGVKEVFIAAESASGS